MSVGVRTPLGALLGAAVLAGAAQVSFEADPVPITLQTAAVLVVGGLGGARVGVLAVVFYIAAVAVGLGVLAGGATLDPRALGETKSLGFLVGFVPGAATASLAVRRAPPRPHPFSARRTARGLAAMVLAHAVILALGWAWLARFLGPGPALEHGVVPYLPGAGIKSILAASIVLFVDDRFGVPLDRLGGRGANRPPDSSQ